MLIFTSPATDPPAGGDAVRCGVKSDDNQQNSPLLKGRCKRGWVEKIASTEISYECGIMSKLIEVVLQKYFL